MELYFTVLLKLEKFDKKKTKSEGQKSKVYSSSPKDSATFANLTYDSRYCLPFGVITKVFFPSNSILLIKPAPVKFDKNFDSLECDRLALVSKVVVLIPS